MSQSKGQLNMEKIVEQQNHGKLMKTVFEVLRLKRPNRSQVQLVEALLLNVNIVHKTVCAPDLTAREVSVLLFAAKGLSIKETAEILQVKSSTVTTWRKNIIKKLSCTNITHAVSKGIQYGYGHKNFI